MLQAREYDFYMDVTYDKIQFKKLKLYLFYSLFSLIFKKKGMTTFILTRRPIVV